MGSYEELRARHVVHLMARFPELVAGLRLSGAELARLRLERLRALVAHAVERSAFHRERLSGIDPAAMTEEDLQSVPRMSKRDLVDSFEDIVADSRLTRDTVEQHLSSLGTGDKYLFDEYHVVATGGSSGQRALIVWDWDGWADCFISLSRNTLVRTMGLSEPSAVAAITADHASHMSSAIGLTFSNPAIPMHKIPASLPLAEIVRRLEEVRPGTLLGYASMIHRLALEAASGRLHISPDDVYSGSEALVPETRELVREVWGVNVLNNYGASETGGIAASCGLGDWMHLSDDLHVIEIEDDRVVVTNLMNRGMPLIRYELDDRTSLVDVECPCGSGHRAIADVEGRANETFVFSGTAVHPIVFSTAIGKNRAVAEYQVRQRCDGIDIDVVPQAKLDVGQLRVAVERGLREAGVSDTGVTVRVVNSIARHGATAKLRRFVPFEADAVGG